jgi:endogenous inhibitor of DNA gyrase (YacG/DUF329 family)
MMFVEDHMDRPARVACAHCGKIFKVSPHGRLPVFCSPSCRSMSFVKKNRTSTKVPAGERQRRMLWQMLVDLKLVSPDTPMPPPHKAEDA